MAKNNKTRFFYVLYSDKTRVFDQSERAYYSIYIIILDISGLILKHKAVVTLICMQRVVLSLLKFIEPITR